MPPTGKVSKPAPNDNQRTPKREGKHPLDVAIFLFLVITAVATAAAACYTRSQWLVAADSESRQLRAYVGVVPGDVEDFGGPNQRLTLIRKNYGQTPAYDVGASVVGVTIVKASGPAAIVIPPSGCGVPSVYGLITMFPSMTLPLSIDIKENFSKNELALVQLGESGFVYYGTVCYHDAFGESHYTNYCWMYKGTDMTAKTAEGCLQHNDSN
jgi:hypothetical protein